MNRFVVRPLSGETNSGPPVGVSERVLQTPEDGQKVIRVLDLRRDSFGADLTYVFGQNVSRARQENERITGSPDGVVERG